MRDMEYLYPNIWSRLPDHLLEHVLSFLPLKTFLSLRSTCKHFTSILYSPFFISKHSSSSNSSPFSSFILLSHPYFDHKSPLFNTNTNSWSNISLPFPPILSSYSNINLLSSSSNGLLCFSVPTSSSFVVCNLLSNSSRLVNFPKLPFNVNSFTFIFTSSKNSYNLFMTSSSNNNALVYDSTLNAWQCYTDVEPNLNDQKGVIYNDYLLFTTPEPFRVVGFNLESGKWDRSSKIGLPLPGGLTFVRLVSDDDNRKLYMIGGVGVSGISRSMRLWEWNEEGENWLEVELVPETVYRKFVSVCYHNYEHVYCFWHQGLICVCCYTWPEILYYKVCRKTWHWLPKCPSLPEKWSFGFRWFFFQATALC